MVMRDTASGDGVDRIGLTLLHKQLVNICDEMAVSMMSKYQAKLKP